MADSKAIDSLIGSFASSKVAANLLMIVFIICGVYAIINLTVRFFPKFEVNNITVTVVWRGATPADIEDSVVVPLENKLRTVPDFNKMYSYSREGIGLVVLEFPDHVDLSQALEDVKTEADRATLPADAEAAEVVIAEFAEPMLRVSATSENPAELRKIGRRLERELGALNAGKVNVHGIQKEEINVLAEQRRLVELDLSIRQIGDAIANQNLNASVGSIDSLGSRRLLRANAETSELSELGQVAVAADANGNLIRLREIAQIKREPASNQVRILFDGKPAVQFQITNNDGADILAAAARITDWVESTRTSLPPSVELIIHEQEWQGVQDRLALLAKNGFTGLLLVLVVLFLFLSGRVAFWVAAGIPVAMMGTLFVLYQIGSSINMISMFALIMAIGIIVDDAIVVGENAQHRLGQGEDPLAAVTNAGHTMFAPVLASALTTIAAFLPLFLVSGPIGSVIHAIPTVIVCILIAAIIECFLVLPGHLYHSFAGKKKSTEPLIRRRFDAAFNAFRAGPFRKMVRAAVNHPSVTITACIMTMVLSIGLLVNGFVGFRFFPGGEGNKLFASITFNSGTPRQAVEEFVDDMSLSLQAADASLSKEGESLIKHVSIMYGQGGEFTPNADERARIVVAMIDPSLRKITVAEMAEAWRQRIIYPPGLSNLDIRGESSGPPGRDIEVRLTASEVGEIKEISQVLQDALSAIPGISSVGDDTPYGKEEIVIELTPLARSLNLRVSDIVNQLSSATDGYLVQTFTEGVDEIDLRVKLADLNKDEIGAFLFRLPSGEYVPFTDLISTHTTQGFETIVHQYGSPAVVVTGDLDPNAPTTVGEILAQLEEGVLRELAETRGVSYSFEGKNKDEQQTAQDMQTGLLLAVILTYIILTWSFNSWTMPLVIMVTMPLGLIGAIIGHWLMGMQMSILSFFGMFTLMGIIVNDSIILVKCFLDLRDKADANANYNELIVDAVCARLRAVALTSLTTICGLLPLIFETSLQAQFLIPMAVSISFGLGFATILILLFMPACMAIHGRLSGGHVQMRKQQQPEMIAEQIDPSGKIIG